MKFLAITSLIAAASAVNGLVLPRQSNGGDMSQFENQECKLLDDDDDDDGYGYEERKKDRCIFRKLNKLLFITLFI